MPQELSERQEIRYREVIEVWRETESVNPLDDTEMDGLDFARVEEGIRCWIETGISVKARAGFVRPEGDNMFTLDVVHTTPEVDIDNLDWIRLTHRLDEDGNSVALDPPEWWKVRGGQRLRNLHANKQSFETARTDPPPELLAAVEA